MELVMDQETENRLVTLQRELDNANEQIRRLTTDSYELLKHLDLARHGPDALPRGTHNLSAIESRIRTLESAMQTLGSNIERQHGLAPGEITDLFEDLAWWSQ